MYEERGGGVYSGRWCMRKGRGSLQWTLVYEESRGGVYGGRWCMRKAEGEFTVDGGV